MNSKIMLGNSSHQKIKEIIQENGFHKIFLVTNKNSFLDAGVSHYIYQGLIGCEYFRFNDFSNNPKSEDVDRGVIEANHFKPDLIIGVGGGSAMDMAKLIKQKLNTKLMLIPTTCGSGSEATHFAVVYVDGKKQSIADNSLLPDFCIVDGLMSENLPKNITAYTGIDAIAQAIESYWSKNATAESKSFSLKALKLLVPSIETAVRDPNLEMREKMAIGAYHAGQAINISKTTAPHAFAYYLTSKYQIPHGHAVGILLPYFIEKNAAAISTEMTPILEIFGLKSSQELKIYFCNLMKKIGLYQELKDILSTSDVDNFITSVNLERLKNNPVEFTHKEFVELFTLE